MPGLARKITSDFRSKKKEDLEREVIYSFESTWFKVEDTETDMPLLDKKKVEKLFFVDGSKRHIKKYSDAIYKSLKSIAAISRVVNSDNLKEIPNKFFKAKREMIKKESKLKWPKLNFSHYFYYNEEILSLSISSVEPWYDELPESKINDRCIKVGESGHLLLILVVNPDGSLKETIINDKHSVDYSKGIHVPPHHLLTIEEFNKWRAWRTGK